MWPGKKLLLYLDRQKCLWRFHTSGFTTKGGCGAVTERVNLQSTNYPALASRPDSPNAPWM